MKRVLIADDDPRLRMLVRHTLDMAEIELLEAADGETALAIARSEQPDLVLLDWAMPRVSGIDVCRRLKSDPATAHIKVLMLTARTQRFNRRAATAAQVDDYVVKPFSPLDCSTGFARCSKPGRPAEASAQPPSATRVSDIAEDVRGAWLRGSAMIRQLVVFTIEGQRYGIPLTATERVLPMVAVAPLPGCPDVVLGAINLHGAIVPVVDMRRRLGLAAREYGPAARLLVATTRRRTVALPVDDVGGVIDVSIDRIAPPEAVVPRIAQLSGIAALADGLMLVHDLDAFLSLDEERQLDEALAGDRP